MLNLLDTRVNTIEVLLTTNPDAGNLKLNRTFVVRYKFFNERTLRKMGTEKK